MVGSRRNVPPGPEPCRLKEGYRLKRIAELGYFASVFRTSSIES